MMANGENHPSLTNFTKKYKRVTGLSNYATASPCRVFRLNPDGTKGELLRIETSEPIKQPMEGR